MRRNEVWKFTFGKASKNAKYLQRVASYDIMSNSTLVSCKRFKGSVCEEILGFFVVEVSYQKHNRIYNSNHQSHPIRMTWYWQEQN